MPAIHQIATRVRVTGESATSVVNKKAAAMKRAGRKVFDLAQGEVGDIFTPEHVKDAAVRALRDNRTKYTPTSGVPELREAIAARFARENSIDLPASQVLVSTGAKQSVFNFMMAVLEPGDEVLIPEPYWVSYLQQVQLAAGRPVVIPTPPENGFKLTGDLIREHMTPRTRAIVLNTPNNPSGAVYSKDDLEEILDPVLNAGILVLADEVYDRLTYDGVRHCSFASLGREAADVTVTVNAVSKAYSMTGWRLGFAGGPAEVISAMEQVQSHVTSCPNAIAQWAAVAALNGDQGWVEALRSELDARRRRVLAALAEAPEFECVAPEGAFYAFPEYVGSRTGKEGFQDGAAFSEALLDATGVMVVPGTAFGRPHHVRICFGASRADLDEGIPRMSAWLASRGEEESR